MLCRFSQGREIGVVAGPKREGEVEVGPDGGARAALGGGAGEVCDDVRAEDSNDEQTAAPENEQKKHSSSHG